MLFEVADLVWFAFEVVVVEVFQNEVENGEACLDEFKGVAAPVTDVLFLNGFVNGFKGELIDTTIVLERNLLEVLLLGCPLDEGMNRPSRFALDEISKLSFNAARTRPASSAGA